MPTIRKLDEIEVDKLSQPLIKRRRGRPRKEDQEQLYTFTCLHGCKIQTGIKNAEVWCGKHSLKCHTK
jgi:hypothetical protein